MNDPLVSVICLCYNHEKFVEEALRSVAKQTYSNVQLVVVDDHSTDHSAQIIRGTLSQHPGTEFLPLVRNVGNCAAFNRGFAVSRGDFIIDLSADDVLMPERIARGVEVFLTQGKETGVNFTDAQLIDAEGKILGWHSDRFPHDTIPQGDIYGALLSRYFINGPTMMIRREVLELLGGYDESLAYEDFDFWVRSSRYFKYCYTPEPLVKRRILNSSLGKRQYKPGTKQLHSTLNVCEKALTLNRNSEENACLKKRIFYEMRQALRLREITLAFGYWKLLRKIAV